MIGVGIVLLAFAVIAGVIAGNTEGNTLAVLFCIIFFIFGIVVYGISVEDEISTYYEKRIPDLKQLLDNYEVDQLEQRIIEIKGE